MISPYDVSCRWRAKAWQMAVYQSVVGLELVGQLGVSPSV